MFLRGVQRIGARCHIGLPAIAGVVVRAQRVVIACVERDTGKRVVSDRLQQAVNTGVQTGFGFLQRLNQCIYRLLRMLDGAVFVCRRDVSVCVLREQTVIQILCVRSLAVERSPAVSGVAFFLEVAVER